MGKKSMTLDLPVRNMDTESAVCNLGDCQRLRELLTLTLEKAGEIDV